MLNPNQPSVAPKKPSLKDSVDSLIQRKKSEKERSAAESAGVKMEGVKGEVADVMGGMEKSSEYISEKTGESGEKGDITGGGVAPADEKGAADIKSKLEEYVFPSEEVMIKKIRTSIQMQIAQEMKNAAKFKSGLTKGNAAKYNEAIAKVRRLKQMLSSLFTMTMGAIREMYVKYFTPGGKRKR